MSAINCSSQRVIDIYLGDVANNIQPAGPCNVLFSVDGSGNVNRVCLLSETQFGRVALTFIITDTISRDGWAGQQGNATLAGLQPIEVEGIDTARSVITCNGNQVNDILGGLQDSPILYSLSGNKVAKVVKLDASNQGQPVLGFSIPAATQLTEQQWLAVNASGRKVDDIDLTNVI